MIARAKTMQTTQRQTPVLVHDEHERHNGHVHGAKTEDEGAHRLDLQTRRLTSATSEHPKPECEHDR